MKTNKELLAAGIRGLSDRDTLKELFHPHRHGEPMPSQPALREIIELCRAVLFPGFYGNASLDSNLPYHIGVDVERLFELLASQIEAGLCFRRGITDDIYGTGIRARAAKIAATLISRLPDIRRVLATDVEAAYSGDPAADSFDEIICCYPVIKALISYRVAHELHLLDVPMIPRSLSEMAHSETGIDIHPAATIGTHFTIDHGTGVVIGATCIIGHHVKLYQGVTLGAKSFPLDENGHPIKHVPRHPLIGNHVIIYSNSTVLGRITIGDHVVIGGNVWLTHDVAAGSVIRQTAPCRDE